MKYKVTVKHDGTWVTDVVNPERHVCGEIVQQIGSFGTITSAKPKKDDIPVKDNIHVSGRS